MPLMQHSVTSQAAEAANGGGQLGDKNYVLGDDPEAVNHVALVASKVRPLRSLARVLATGVLFVARTLIRGCDILSTRRFGKPPPKLGPAC
jgi:hypothetical protein